VKDIVFSLYKVIHGELVSDIRDVDPHPVLNLFNVEKVTSLSREHVVDYRYMGPQFDKIYGKVASNEAKTTCYENLFIFESVHILFSPSSSLPRKVFEAFTSNF